MRELLTTVMRHSVAIESGYKWYTTNPFFVDLYTWINVTMLNMATHCYARQNSIDTCWASRWTSTLYASGNSTASGTIGTTSNLFSFRYSAQSAVAADRSASVRRCRTGYDVIKSTASCLRSVGASFLQHHDTCLSACIYRLEIEWTIENCLHSSSAIEQTPAIY